METELPMSGDRITDDSLTRQARKRTPSEVIHFPPNLQSPLGEPLNLLRADQRNDALPLANGSRTEPQRPRDIRGALKVIQNVLFEHASDLTAFKRRMQPHLSKADLTSVYMDKFATLSDRLTVAMRATSPPVSASDLARACDVSPAAVSKWLDGGTKKLSADNYAAASRALGVREEWLRTGRLPMEREFGDQEREIDQVVELLDGLQEPLSELVKAIDRLRQARPKTTARRQKA